MNNKILKTFGELNTGKIPFQEYEEPQDFQKLSTVDISLLYFSGKTK